MNTRTELNLKKIIADLVKGLPEQEQRVLSLYYCDRLTLKEVALVLGITDLEVQEIYANAVSRCLNLRQGRPVRPC